MRASRLVVVGGGISGHKIAYALQDSAEVTLVDPKDFFEIPMAAPRQLVAPGELASIIPYSEFLTRARLVRGKAIALRDGEVEVVRSDVHETIPYDWLVLATGSAYRDELTHARAGSLDDRRAHYEHMRRRIMAAGNIVIVGGGPVGVEIAGEISRDFPGKRIALLEAGDRLLAATSDKPSRWAAEMLRARGVELRLNERLGSAPADGMIVTDSGAELPCELLLSCVGASPETGWLRNGLVDGALDPAGRIMVEPTLQVRGLRNVLAAGDITACDELKLGVWAGTHAGVVTTNLRRLMVDSSTSATTLKAYKPAKGNRLMLATLGRDAGVMHLPFGQFRAGWLARMLKAKSMLVPTLRKGIGLGAG